jgi:hypothetical protein
MKCAMIFRLFSQMTNVQTFSLDTSTSPVALHPAITMESYLSSKYGILRNHTDFVRRTQDFPRDINLYRNGAL